MPSLDLNAFLAADFTGRIRLTNEAHGTRLWSAQLASVWGEVLDRFARADWRSDPIRGRLMRELMALAPDTTAAERHYESWIGDDDRASPPPPIVYLIISCLKPSYKAKAIAHYWELSAHLEPIFIVIGGEAAAEATFDGPFIKVPVPDNYESLPLKVLEGLVAARRRFGRVGVLKIDDDTRFIAPPQSDGIAELVATTQYAGTIAGDHNFDRCWHVGKCERLRDQPFGRRFRGGWAAGPLYYLGPEAVEVLVREYLFFPGEFDGEIFEDKVVGDVLRAHGIEPVARDLSPIFGMVGPFGGAFGDRPPELAPLAIDGCDPRESPPAPGWDVASASGRRAYWEGFFSRSEDPWRYDNPYERRKYQQTLSLLPLRPINTALELGCAEGHFSAQLALHVGHLLATDIAPTAIARAQSRCAELPNVEFQTLDFIEDTIPGGFDLIVCSESLYYCRRNELPALATKFAAALNPAGYLLMAHPVMIADERDYTGFDWGHEFGVKTIAAVFAARDDLVLLKELRTPLYRIQLFRRRDRREQLAAEIIEAAHGELPPAVERTVIWGGAVLTRAEALAQERSSQVPILLYHSIADDGPPELAPYRVAPAAFRDQLRFLRRHGYHSISLDEWVRHIDRSVPISGRAVVITFDDGCKNFLTEAAPLLEAADFRATVFVVSDRVGGVADWDAGIAPQELMNWDDLRELQQRGFTIGSHTTSHIDLLTLSDRQIVDDGIAARARLRQELGRDVASIAFPWGKSDAQVRAALQRAGYHIGVDTWGGRSTLEDDPCNLPRIEIFGGEDIDAFARRLESKGDGASHRRTPPPAPVSGANDAVACPVISKADEAAAPSIASGIVRPAAVPEFDRQLVTSLDSVIDSLKAIAGELPAPFGVGSLEHSLAALFRIPVVEATTRPVQPYQPVSPGVHFGFEDTAKAVLTAAPKSSHGVSPETYLNTLEFDFSGTSRWLSLEAACLWSEFTGARHYQLSFNAEADRHVSCSVALRLPHPDGDHRNHEFASFELHPGQRICLKSGKLQLPDPASMDTTRLPMVLFFFHQPATLLTLRLDYINLYFA